MTACSFPFVTKIFSEYNPPFPTADVSPSDCVPIKSGKSELHIKSTSHSSELRARRWRRRRPLVGTHPAGVRHAANKGSMLRMLWKGYLKATLPCPLSPSVLHSPRECSQPPGARAERKQTAPNVVPAGRSEASTSTYVGVSRCSWVHTEPAEVLILKALAFACARWRAVRVDSTLQHKVILRN